MTTPPDNAGDGAGGHEELHLVVAGAATSELDGRVQIATEHLRAALAADPSIEEWAPHDADFAALRDRPAWPV